MKGAALLYKKSLKIRDLTLRNRIVMPPMASRKGDPDGQINDAVIEHYAKRTESGKLGLVIVEHSCVNVQGKVRSSMLSLADDVMLEGHKRLTDCIHAAGMPVIAQINHCGALSDPAATGMPVIAPSAVVHPGDQKGSVPAAMAVEEIDRLVDDFAEAAVRAMKAGYDGVEVHSAHGYLLNQFYSPLTNKREDAYGCGSIEDRLRVHRRVLQAVREVIGSVPLFLRLGGCDYIPGGTTVNDTVQAAPLLESYGIDLLDISGGLNGYTIPGYTEPGYFREITDAVRNKVHIPLILTGGVKTADQAEQLLQDHAADLIGIGRAIYADPGWAAENL